MKKSLLLLAVVVLVALIAAVPAKAGRPTKAGRPIHSVSVGGPDVCEGLGLPIGCDANQSLSARERADGSVSGQWTDRFSQGGGFHATIDCLSVSGNRAWVSGVVSNGPDAGVRVAIRVADNGTSANDPVDQIGFSLTVADDFDCTTQPDSALFSVLFDAPQGQVKVR